MNTQRPKLQLSTIQCKVANISHNYKQMLWHINLAKSNSVDVLIFGICPLTTLSLGYLKYNKELQQSVNDAIQQLVEVSLTCDFDIIFVENIAQNGVLQTQVLRFSQGTIKSIVFEPNKKHDSNEDILLHKKSDDIAKFALSFSDISDRFKNDGYDFVISFDDCLSEYDVDLLEKFYTNNSSIKSLEQKNNINTTVVIGANVSESVSQGVYNSTKLVINNQNIVAKASYWHYCIIVLLGSKDFKNENYITPKFRPELPFVPTDVASLDKIIDILSHATYQRLKETRNKGVILGVSGGLDSAFVLCLARWIQTRHSDFGTIYGVTMHTSNTSKLSLYNAKALIECCNATHIDIPIGDAVQHHLGMISHGGKHDITYQNAHARRRTSLLLDLSNMYNVLHLGTGDMSEIALGWSTYGGDQLSQFNPNSNLTKTMLQALLPHLAKKLNDPRMLEVCNKIVNAPISPELVPNQKTEDELGPYALFDFITYHWIFKNRSLVEVYQLCCEHFEYLTSAAIKEYLKMFINRFYLNQFKRKFACDGVHVQNYDFDNLEIVTSVDTSMLVEMVDNF